MTRRDHGAILPLVLVVTFVLALVVVGVANYTATTLRYGQVVESRADRLASADAAMADAIEQLQLRRNLGPLCSAFGGDGDGVSAPFPQKVNGVDVTVNCKIVGGKLPPLNGWAIVITGEVAPGEYSFEFSNGGTPEIGGPVYVNEPRNTKMEFGKDTTIFEGDLWYPDASCANAGGKDPTDINFAPSPLKFGSGAGEVDNNLLFSPNTRGMYCLNRTWKDLFGQDGPVPADLTALPTPDPLGDDLTYPGCRVFSPGVYLTKPDLGEFNYFRSGNYEFADIGLLKLFKQVVHFGHDSTLAGTYPITDNSDECDYVRQNDADTGATLYTSGSTQIDIGTQSKFEISRREQTYVRPNGEITRSLVAFQVLDSLLASDESLIVVKSGQNAEFASNGLFWAPKSSLLFETVPGNKAAVLHGGAVLGRFKGKIATDGYRVMDVLTSGSDTKLLLTAVAKDDRGETSVRVVADYRPANGKTAVNSWRVVD